MTSESGPLVVPLNSAGTEWVSLGPLSEASGWGIYSSSTFGLAGPRPSLFVRFGRAMSGGDRPPVVPREIWCAFPEGLGPRALRDLPLARIEAAVNQPMYYEAALARSMPPNAVLIPFPWTDDPVPDWWTAKPAARRAPKLKLRVPAGRPKPDEFYRQVADRFGYLATVSQRPARDLAEANGVDATTVHGWVKEARRRGLLPAGERSRRGKETS